MKLKFEYGGIAKWTTAADCKSARIAYVGSNPTPSTTELFLNIQQHSKTLFNYPFSRYFIVQEHSKKYIDSQI